MSNAGGEEGRQRGGGQTEVGTPATRDWEFALALPPQRLGLRRGLSAASPCACRGVLSPGCFPGVC